MGRLSVKGTQRPRRPLYLLPEEYPYTPDQLQALRDAYASAARGRSFDPHWPRVRDEARKCARNIKLQKLRKPNPVVWRPFERAVKRGDVTALIESESENANALLYGAMRAGLVVEAPGDNYDAELAQLRQLSLPQLEAALAAAKAKDSILYNMGPPKGGPIENFAVFVGVVYEETTNRSLGAWYDYKKAEWKGPAIRFFRAALAPFQPDIKPRGIKALIDRIKAQVPLVELKR